MSNTTEKIEHLEGSIAHVQDGLDDAQQVLAVAEETQKKADEMAANIRRIAIGVAIAGVVLALFVTARRRRRRRR